MPENIKKAVLFHDMSCFGRCALSVIIPIISVLKIQPVIIPTALLSTHTGGFSDFTFLDLTGEIKKIIAHYDKLSLIPDCVYTGFVVSEQQIEIISDYIKNIKNQKNSFIFVDPVMGDDGKLYSLYTDGMKRKMIKLAMSADIITPNITEAFFLLGMDYQNPPYKKDFIDKMICNLFELCEYNNTEQGRSSVKKIVITSVMLDTGEYGAAYGENIDKKISLGYVFTRLYGKNYPGSGDIFSSVLCGRILNGSELRESVESAVKFTDKVIEYTINAGTPVREGLIFEKFLSELV